MGVEFVVSGVRVTKGTGENIQKENSERKVERRKIAKWPSEET